MSGEIEVKDRRRAPWFYVDNHVLDKYAKLIGPMAWAIYTTMCRLANEKVHDDGTRRRNRKISVNGLASMWGISRATVKRATSVLRKENLIRVTKRQGVSDVEILNVEQLNFDDKLNFGGLTSEPSKPVPDSSRVSPPKAHRGALPGLTYEPHSKPIDTKPSLSKPSGVDAGFKPAAATKKKQNERTIHHGTSPQTASPGTSAAVARGVDKFLRRKNAVGMSNVPRASAPNSRNSG